DADLPKYLLLFADCAADNRMITEEWKRCNPNDFLLCFQSELSSSETRSYIMEEYFCLLDDNEGTNWVKAKSDMAVGRLTVHSLEQATIVVDKIENYMAKKESGSWKNKVCVMGDDGDNNRHMVEADAIVQRIQDSNPHLVVEKVYWDAYKCENGSTGRRYPEVTRRIRDISTEGALMMYYTGHGRADELSHELVWGTKEMEALSSPRLPLWVTAACDTSPIDLPKDNMGETALLNQNAGAIAFLGATRSTYGSESNAMHKAFCKQLFVDGHTLGEALRLAKNETTLYNNTENNLHYVLIGDPALKLAIADQYEVKITEVNGETVDGAMKQFKTGSQVTLKGEVVDQSGKRVTAFNGLVYPSVYGSRQNVVCNGNDPELDEVYEFWDYAQQVYTGSDSVRSGEFTFTFPVPLDVNYSVESGNINFYAMDMAANEAQGSYTDFYLDGTVENLPDNAIGPKISMFLNTTNFVSGDVVNETPLLMLALHDEDGINTTGNGIGHDLIAIIDNDPQMTYVLNSYYQSAAGDYTRGSLTYSLPALQPGVHSIMVRAWDILNNSSTVHATFEVVQGLSPALGKVWCTDSPARTSTTFVVSHDRPLSELSVQIEVFDFSGRILWSHTENSSVAGFEHRIPWSLTTSGGQPVGDGIYLYRATISSANGGGSATKTQKIIVKRQ
ncbi:MAG: type IX secretion system sortase PorU, partial [Bacteroidaceae bacterium]|nr:type IX secretion system sortase PorU [Bacteroidaceae bacterium]